MNQFLSPKEAESRGEVTHQPPGQSLGQSSFPPGPDQLLDVPAPAVLQQQVEVAFGLVTVVHAHNVPVPVRPQYVDFNLQVLQHFLGEFLAGPRNGLDRHHAGGFWRRFRMRLPG